MDKLAFITESAFIYWSPIIIALSAFAAICIFFCVYIGRGGNVSAGFICVPFCVLFGLLFSRIVHWYCCSGSYSGFQDAIVNYSDGEFALVGVFIACILVACLLRLIKLTNNLPAMLDAMSIGGVVGIAFGRLAPLFNSECRGMLMGDNVGFPFAYPLINPVSGASENRLATFMLQSFAAIIIAVILIVYMLVQHFRRKKIKDGDIFLIFISAYSICQIVCDSTRYDALVLRSNGFVSMVQIVGLIALLAVIGVFSVRLIKNRGFKFWYLSLWVGMAAMLGVAGYMEYFVQNNGNQAFFAYSMMFGALVCLFAILMTIRFLASGKKATTNIAEDNETSKTDLLNNADGLEA